MSFLSKLLRKRKYEKESFSARLQMESDAQDRTRARLEALEVLIRNQGRLK